MSTWLPKMAGLVGLLLAVCLVAVGCGAVRPNMMQATPPHGSSASSGIHKIKHIVIIMQENRSFDSYFGTYPGADGIPMTQGMPTVCVLDPKTRQCVKPFRDRQDRNYGGPHGAVNATGDIDQSKMDGFIREEEHGRRQACKVAFNPNCSAVDEPPDVMGYHDGNDIPNYWTYARTFVLQDHMFESAATWSLPVHLFMIAAWSAYCTKRGDPLSCHNDLFSAALPPDFGRHRRGSLVRRPDYAWTDLTYLLHQHHVSWAYYVANGTQPDCADDAMFCRARHQRAVRRVSGTRCPTSTQSTRTDSSATSGRSPGSMQPRRRARSPQSPGSCPMTRTASIHQAGLAWANRT